MTCIKCIQNGSAETTNQKYWVMYSGGKDSSCVAYKLIELDQFEGVVVFDTGICATGFIEWIKDTCEKRKWKLHIEKGGYMSGNEKIQSYDQFVKKFGFPKPFSHSWIMRIVKGRAFTKFKKAHTVDKIKPKVASGVRQKESKRRMKNVTGEYGEFDGCKVWNAVYNWDNDQVWEYVRKYKIEISPAYKTIHMSGDCLCGAYARKDEVDIIKMFYPEVADRLTKLENEIKDNEKIPKQCRYWGYKDGEGFHSKQTKLDSILCAECDINTSE